MSDGVVVQLDCACAVASLRGIFSVCPGVPASWDDTEEVAESITLFATAVVTVVGLTTVPIDTLVSGGTPRLAAGSADSEKWALLLASICSTGVSAAAVTVTRSVAGWPAAVGAAEITGAVTPPLGLLSRAAHLAAQSSKLVMRTCWAARIALILVSEARSS